MAKRKLAVVELEPRLTPSTSSVVYDMKAITGDSQVNTRTLFNGLYYYTPNDPNTGGELRMGEVWVTDLTAAGTYFVTDVIPEPVYSHASTFVFNDKLFITTYVQSSNAITNKLFVSDGTAAGTHPLLDSNGNSFDFWYNFAPPSNGLLYFTGRNTGYDWELWRTDGTSSGTYMVRDINPGAGGSWPNYTTNVNGILYFDANDGVHGIELWRSDGTSSGTYLVKDIRPVVDMDPPRGLINVNGTLYFCANDNVTGYELWKSDGTSSGTVLVKDIQPGIGTGTSSVLFSVAFGDRILFNANDGVHGNELWISDGTSSGTQMIADFAPGSAWFNPLYFTAFNGKIFFVADNQGSAIGSEIWQTDGTSSGTTLLRDINPLPTGYRPSQLQVINNTLYFITNDGIHGDEPWMSDGTSAGTRMIADIHPGPDSSHTWFDGFHDNQLFLSADDGRHGQELWSTDGTNPGTQMLWDSNTTAVPTANYGFTRIGEHEYFVANRSLWRTDGTSGGTQTIFDPRGIVRATPQQIPITGGFLFVHSDDEYRYGEELWFGDGTSTGNRLVRDIVPGSSGSKPKQLTSMNGIGYFFVDKTLWRSDGTSAGTQPITPALNPWFTNLFAVAGNKLYFSANIQNNWGLWTSDGFNPPELVRSFPWSTQFPAFTNVNGSLYFTANGTELWRSEGTAASTVRVDTFPLGALSNLAGVGGLLTFKANDAVAGAELWRSDGTTGGTFRLRDIKPGSAGSNPSPVVAIGPLGYFTANGASGTELWVSDGTTSGTNKVRSFASATSLTNANGLLVLLADDGVNGIEVWQSNGTSAGTVMQELAPGAASASPANLFTLGSRAFATTPDGNAGFQLRQIHTVPTLTGLSTTAPAGVVSTGQAIEIVLEFDRPVRLAGGGLTLKFNSGPSALVRVGPFEGTSVRATYTVSAGHTVPRLQGASLALDGGATLRDADDADVALLLPASNFTAAPMVVNPLPPTTVASVTTNSGLAGSRITRVELAFSRPVNAATLAQPGVITLVRAGTPSLRLDLSNGLRLSATAGAVSQLSLTFDNVLSDVLNFGSLADGRWRIEIPYLNYTSPEITRLFGDVNGDGTVDGPSDFSIFKFRSAANDPFDFNVDGVVDGPTDFAQFGARFGKTV